MREQRQIGTVEARRPDECVHAKFHGLYPGSSYNFRNRTFRDLNLERRSDVHLKTEEAFSDRVPGVFVDGDRHELTIHDLH